MDLEMSLRFLFLFNPCRHIKVASAPPKYSSHALLRQKSRNFTCLQVLSKTKVKFGTISHFRTQLVSTTHDSHTARLSKHVSQDKSLNCHRISLHFTVIRLSEYSSIKPLPLKQLRHDHTPRSGGDARSRTNYMLSSVPLRCCPSRRHAQMALS